MFWALSKGETYPLLRQESAPLHLLMKEGTLSKVGPCTVAGSVHGFPPLGRNLAKADQVLSIHSLQPASSRLEVYLFLLSGRVGKDVCMIMLSEPAAQLTCWV